MGRLSEALKAFFDEFREVLELVHLADGREKQDAMYDFVFKCFSELEPLSHKFKVIRYIPEWDCELCVGKWIRLRYCCDVYGSVVKRRSRFFKVIRNYGEEVARHVRKPIRDVFAELVECVKQLKSYVPHVEEIPVSKTGCLFDLRAKEAVIKEVEVVGLRLDLSDPRYVGVLVKRGGPYDLFIYSWKHMSLFEDLLPELKLLYKKGAEFIREVDAHNRPLFEKMKELVAPFTVMEALTS